MDRYRRYFLNLLSLIVAGLLIVASTNVVIDPYAFYGSPIYKRVNANKPLVGKRVVLAKAVITERLKPNAVILGTSRAEIGIDANHPGWRDLRCYNLAFPGAGIYETYRFLQHAQALRPLKLVAMEVSLFRAAGSRPDFNEANFRVSPDGEKNMAINKEYWASVISLESFEASLQTLSHNVRRPHVILYTSDGQRLMTDRLEKIRKKTGHFPAFLSIIDQIARAGLVEREKGVEGMQRGRKSALEQFRTILRFAHQQQIDLRLFISPNHAWLLEAIRLTADNSWHYYEEWMRSVVRVNEEEAQRANAAPFPLWSFEGYNSITTEPVPGPGQQDHEMQWYIEALHYKKVVGDLMLDKILDYKDSERHVPNDFGLRLTGNNIEPYLTTLRRRQLKYQHTHPDDVKFIARRIKQIQM